MELHLEYFYITSRCLIYNSLATIKVILTNWKQFAYILYKFNFEADITIKNCKDVEY